MFEQNSLKKGEKKIHHDGEISILQGWDVKHINKANKHAHGH